MMMIDQQEWQLAQPEMVSVIIAAMVNCDDMVP